MYRVIAVMFSASVIVLSILGIMYPEGSLSFLMNTETDIAVGRIIFASLLLAYSAVALLRYDLFRQVIWAAGLGTTWFTLTSILADNAPIPGPVDLFFGVEGVVLSIIASFDFARPKQVQRFLPSFGLLERLTANTSQLHLPESPQSATTKTA